MSDSILILRNPHNQTIDGQPICVGVPFPVNACHSVSELSFFADQGVVHCYELMALESWSDQSIKWVLIQAVVSVPANSEMHGRLIVEPEPNTPVSQEQLKITESPTSIELATAECCYRFDKMNGFFPSIDRTSDQSDSTSLTGISADLLLIDSNNQTCRFELKDQTISTGTRGQIATITRTGHVYLQDSQRKLLVEVKFTVYANTGLMECSMTIHNPSRALHQDGFWDLGDPGSLLFRSLSVEMNGASLQTPQYCLGDNDSLKAIDGTEVNIVQFSSGGLNRDSKIHMQADGTLPDLSRCCVIQGDNHTTAEIERASPIIFFDNNDSSVAIALEQFWQNFPKAMQVSEGRFTLSLFPDISPSVHELQGGEKKTHRLFIANGHVESSLRWLHKPADIVIDRNAVCHSQVFPYTSAEHIDKEYDSLLSLSLEGDNSFLAKRERVDEYGWRNFGELFADHEIWLYGVSEDFHSHYNNQYDPLSGFARQFALTGDQRWLNLMHDLARHVLDIDLYHTDEDREEYNRGYFWHTNHHVSANTCTHRTFSSSHESDLDSHSVSGGPGEQHCYTTGFRYYYNLSGDQRAKEAVLSITHWVGKTLNGSGNLIDGAIRFLRRGLSDGVQVMKGNSVFRYDYPLDRGTGNYLRALMNSYRLTRDRFYLEQTESVIENTFSANDDLVARNFDDIEGTWYYTVFLQDVGDYLLLKREENDLDDHFIRIYRGFFHYIDWMLKHEKPFLEQESKLEFVNNTWAAQDIRKANLFYVAYLLATDNREAYQHKARYFRKYVIDALKKSDTPWYTRIQAILHQNHGPSSLMYTETPTDSALRALPKVSIPNGYYTRISYCTDYLSGLLDRLKGFSLAKEINWIKSRSGKAVSAITQMRTADGSS